MRKSLQYCSNLLSRFFSDESGLVITAELILIITVAVIALVAGWGAVATMMAEELEDVGNMVGALDQSWQASGFIARNHGRSNAMGFADARTAVNVVANTASSATVGGLGYSASGAGLGYGGAIAGAAPAAVAAPQTLVPSGVLVESELGFAVDLSEAQLVEMISLGIVEVREDGAVILLREDLVEIRDDGSVLILRDAVEREETQLDQQSTSSSDAAHSAEATATEDGTANLRQSRELERENARLRKLIQALCQKAGIAAEDLD